MKIVLDTNCLVVILPLSSPYRWVFDKIKSGEIELAVSNEILFEYAEELGKFYFPELAENTLRFLLTLPKLHLVSIYFRWNLIKADPDDNKYVDCAIAVNADCIVTHDKHFSHLSSIDFPVVHCVSLDEFRVKYFDC